MALLPPFYLDCVVAIGITGTNHLTAWIGTGFFYGFPCGKNEKGEQLYWVYLVTNKHVIGDQREVMVRLNPTSKENGRDFPLVLKDDAGKPTWHTHPDTSIDLAVQRINVSVLNQHAMKFSFFEEDHHVTMRPSLANGALSEGDPVFTLGFPMGHVGTDRLYAICRQGIIARCRDWFDGKGKEILIDASVFPGNSGGPVISSIYPASINGTNARNLSALIGVVQSYIQYQDIAVSQQTRRPRIIFEENSGLASVIPIDFVHEIIAPLHAESELPLSGSGQLPRG